MMGTLLWSDIVLFFTIIIMDYFLSSGTVATGEAINTITMQPIAATTPTESMFSPIATLIEQLIPSDLISMVNFPLL